MQDAGCRVLGAGCRVQDAGCGVQGSKERWFTGQGADSGAPTAPGSGLVGPGFRVEAPSREVEILFSVEKINSDATHTKSCKSTHSRYNSHNQHHLKPKILFKRVIVL